MTILFENVLFLDSAPSTITKRTVADRWGEVINVKSYGAKGDGFTDDAAAIQAAFDAAFGPASSPHGQGGGILNRPVYFPRGLYIIHSTVSVTSVWGGQIFGDGKLVTGIQFTGTITPVNSEGWCPVLWLNGFNSGTIEGIGFQGPDDPTNHSTVALWFGPDGVNGGSSAHDNLIINCTTYGSTWGIIHGSAASAANSENNYIGTDFNQHSMIGLYVSGANSLNMKVYGGGFTGCLLAGAKTNNAGTITLIDSAACQGNLNVDYWFEAAGPCVVSGVRSESASCVKTSAATTMINYLHSGVGGTIVGSVAGAAASFMGSIAIVGSTPILTIDSGFSGTLVSGEVLYGTGVPAGTTLLFPVVNAVANTGKVQWIVDGGSALSTRAMTAGSVLTITGLGTASGAYPCEAIYGSDGTNSLPSDPGRATRILQLLTGSYQSGTLAISQKPSPGSIAGGTTLTTRTVLVEILGAGSVILDNCGSSGDAVIIGNSSGGCVSFRNHIVLDQGLGGLNTDLVKWCSSQVLSFDTATAGIYSVSTLTTLMPPRASLKGLRSFVNDSTLAITNNTNIGAPVVGGSTNTVPVWCDGTTWRIG